RLHANDPAGAGRREPGQVESRTAADVEHGLAGPVVDPPHRPFNHAVGVDAEILLLVDLGEAPDVRAGDHSTGQRSASRRGAGHNATGWLPASQDSSTSCRRNVSISRSSSRMRLMPARFTPSSWDSRWT